MNDNIQHGIDDNPNNDPEKGAALGGLGGAAVGAAAGSIAGPVGTLIGAVAGGLLGAGASGAAVALVDDLDNDNTISGIGSGTTQNLTDTSDPYPGIRASSDDATLPVGGHNVVTGTEAITNDGNTGLAAGAIAGGLVGTAIGGPVGAIVGGTLGSLAGGVAGDAIEAADDSPALAGTDIDAASRYGASADSGRPGTFTDPAATGFSDPAGAALGLSDAVLSPSSQTDYRAVDAGVTSVGVTDQNADTALTGGYGNNAVPGVRTGDDVLGNGVPGIQTGGTTSAGADTRGITEKAADALTGDTVDDKTGGIIR